MSVINWLSDKILGHFWIYGPAGRTCILCDRQERFRNGAPERVPSNPVDDCHDH